MQTCCGNKQYSVGTCGHTNSNQLWVGSSKLWGKPSQDLIVNINRAYYNPITGAASKRNRHINIRSQKLKLSFVTHENDNVQNDDENDNDSNDDENDNDNNVTEQHLQQFENCNTKEYQYSLYGVVNHEGIVAGSGHYVNHILNDSEGKQHQGYQWIYTNSTTVIPHNNFPSLSKNVTTCWFSLDVNVNN